MSAYKIRSAPQSFLIIVGGLMLVLRANAKIVFLTNPPPRWLALYGYLQNFARIIDFMLFTVLLLLS
jgi:hypothetical protein